MLSCRLGTVNDFIGYLNSFKLQQNLNFLNIYWVRTLNKTKKQNKNIVIYSLYPDHSEYEQKDRKLKKSIFKKNGRKKRILSTDVSLNPGQQPNTESAAPYHQAMDIHLGICYFTPLGNGYTSRYMLLHITRQWTYIQVYATSHHQTMDIHLGICYFTPLGNGHTSRYMLLHITRQWTYIQVYATSHHQAMDITSRYMLLHTTRQWIYIQVYATSHHQTMDIHLGICYFTPLGNGHTSRYMLLNIIVTD